MNVFTFTGNLGQDARLGYTTGERSTAVLDFSVACRSGYGDREHTDWINCSLFGARGEKLQQYMGKGAKVAVSGEFSSREYTRKSDGKQMTSLDVRVRELTLLDSRSLESDSAGSDPSLPSQQSGYPESSQGASEAPSQTREMSTDDIPF